MISKNTKTLPATGEGLMPPKTPSGSRPMPSGGFELASWLFMRVSGLLLLFLALGHLAVMHIFNNVDQIDYDFVAERFSTPFWRCYDLLMLLLALFHGFNGLRTIVDDYLRGFWRLAVLSAMYTTVLFVGVIGSVVILTFQPVSPGVF